jgi:hypothetical protein
MLDKFYNIIIYNTNWFKKNLSQIKCQEDIKRENKLPIYNKHNCMTR